MLIQIVEHSSQKIKTVVSLSLNISFHLFEPNDVLAIYFRYLNILVLFSILICVQLERSDNAEWFVGRKLSNLVEHWSWKTMQNVIKWIENWL